MIPGVKIGWGRSILGVMVLAGIASGLARLFLGLGSTTNLSDAYPWGLWISFDVLTGVALASGGFIMTAIIYVFNLKQYAPLLRPAKLSAFVGYQMFVVGLFMDLGMPWRIWHPMIMWNPRSVLFEVSWCAMLYTSVLGLDILIIALEKYGYEKIVGFFRSIYVVFIVAGIVLSTLHQSSLGALYLLIPEKMSDLWAAKILGPLFLISAIAGGLAIITLDNLISARVHHRKPETAILIPLIKSMAVIMLAYFAAKIVDVIMRQATLWKLDTVHLLFYLEMLIPLILSVLLLTWRKARESGAGLTASSSITTLWVVLTRFNVSLTAYTGYRHLSYFPSFVEIAVTVGLVAAGVLLFDLAGRYLPIYDLKSEYGPAGEKAS